MNIYRIFPPERWWRLFSEEDAIVYFHLPMQGTVQTAAGGISRSHRLVLVRGSVVSMRRNRFGTTTMKIRVHAECRLYEEPLLPKDKIVELDYRQILGVDHHGALLL